MEPAGTLDSTTWAALALALTVLGALLSWVAWRRRGAAAGLRGLAWTLLPVAAWLTGTLRLVVAVVEEVVRWATRLVLSPTVWAGIAVLGVAVLLFLVSGVMRSRGTPRSVPARTEDAPRKVPAASRTKPPRGGTGRHESDLDDADDIEAILKKHGI